MDVWTLTISAPMGDIPATLRVADDGTRAEMSGKSGSDTVRDLIAAPGVLSWSTKIERPMPMTLKFDCTHDGATLTGRVKFGVFASGTVSGLRVVDTAA